MNPFVESQVSNLVECIRLLEAFVTAPLGLYSDIKMLRESLSVPEAAGLTQPATRQRRIAYKALAEDPNRMALQAVGIMNDTLDALDGVRDAGDLPFSADWPARARRVLDRTEQRVGTELRAATAARVRGLYVIVDPAVTGGRPALDIARAALDGGASVLQLRDKTGDGGDVLDLARRLRAECEQRSALFVMNDDPTLALVSGAHGVHLGQEDLPVGEVRRVVTQEQIVGRSNNSVDEVVESQAAAVDYLAVGAVFPTSTMGKGDRPVVGVGFITTVKDMVDRPVVAIGGINADNIAEVAHAGADAACVASAVTLAEKPEAAARALSQAMRQV